MIQFSRASGNSGNASVILIDNADLSSLSFLNDAERSALETSFGREQNLVPVFRYPELIWIYNIKENANQTAQSEKIRKAGAELAASLKQQAVESVFIQSNSAESPAAYWFAEGLVLSTYQFLKYRKNAEKTVHPLKEIVFAENGISEEKMKQLEVIASAIFQARDLVNEPLNALNASGLANAIRSLAHDAGIHVQTLTRDDIEREGMGGLLSVNRGSIDPPTFSILEYKPENARNEKPIVLVGKGVVYDTGGVSLKPTPNSMDRMKSDMSGAAVVSTAVWAVAKMQLPLHVIALVPATDNRPGEDAYVPGDIIRMYDGTSVEVLNTDAEGRLLLGDALHWAKRYEPELVIDFATLTGAASVAVGEHGIVCMGTADDSVKQALRDSGERQYERLVEYPLWDEYGEQIKSEIADLKNIGGPSGGAITAGKFLQHFTAYPWMHFDIAGVSFNTAKKGYVPSGGTGYGLRMLLDYLMSR
jgi:leucyl aminopeptidase